jgi:hypothetical protein
METSSACVVWRSDGGPPAAEPKARLPISACGAGILGLATATAPSCAPKTDRAEDLPGRWDALAQMLTEEVQYCERLTWLSEEQRRDLQRF